jgi:hypothetical protein
VKLNFHDEKWNTTKSINKLLTKLVIISYKLQNIESGALGAILFLLLLPLLLMVFFIPAMIIFNSTSEKRRQNLLELANKLQINQDFKELLIE